jgi:nucleoid-associated protein YgaU
VKRLIGVVAAVALAVGMGAGAVTPASAARTVWDKVASCESGGNWKINTGNGYYGGLQFSKSTWRAYGGGKYASTANKASKAEQIAIARRTLADQGPRAWPSCGRKAHLTRSNGKASKSATPSSNPGAKIKKKGAAQKQKASKKKYTGKKAAKASPTGRKTIRVKRGDTLAKIAKRYHVKGGWRGLWKLNKKKVKNPNSIRIGQVLKIRK